MPYRIPRTFIDDLILRTDIVDIVSERIRLQKTGKNYSGLCPFHQEKTPSFSVSPDKQFYHCFGCGKSGNVIGFLMDYDQLEFIEAIETLSQRLGLTLPQHDQMQSGDRYKSTSNTKLIYDILEKATAFYEQQLQLPQAQHAREYLHRRGIDSHTIKQFRLGFAPPGWEHLLQHFQRIDKTLLSSAGLIITNEKGKTYDRFRGRLMFPIRDHRGHITAFGARVLDDSLPKYLNSPETDVFHKNRSIYGLFEARQHYKNLTAVVLVEGYMDVIGLHQHGLHCGVATLGTAISDSHFQRLFRYTDRIVCCFDGDSAGRAAAWRALEVGLACLQDQHSIAFLHLPEGEDPDSLIAKEGKTAFIERLKQAIPLSDFLLNHLTNQYSLESMDGRAQFLQAIKPLFNQLNNGILQQLLLTRIADLCRLSQAQLQPLLQTANSSTATQTNAATPTPTQRLSPMRLAISLLLQYPECAKNITSIDVLRQLELPGSELLLNLVCLLHEDPSLTTAVLLEHWRDDPLLPSLQQLASWPLLIPESGIVKELNGVIERLQLQAKEKQIDVFMRKAKEGSLSVQERSHLQQLLQHQSK